MTKEEMHTETAQWLVNRRPAASDAPELRWSTWMLGQRERKGRKTIVLWLRRDDAVSPCAAAALSLIGRAALEQGTNLDAVAAVTPPAWDDQWEHPVGEIGRGEQFLSAAIPDALRSLAAAVCDSRQAAEIEPYVRRGGLVDGIFAAAAGLRKIVCDDEDARFGAYAATYLQIPEEDVKKLLSRQGPRFRWH